MTHPPASVLELLRRVLSDDVVIDSWQRIPHAYSNEVFRVRSGRTRLVVRVARPRADGLREQELIALRAAADAGISPRPRLTDASGHAVFDDLGGVTLDQALGSDQPPSLTLLRNLAATLRRAHALPLAGAPVYHPGRAALTQLDAARRRGWPIDQAIMEQAAELATTPLRADRLCHNDLNPANVLIGERVWFIDWEWAAAGDPLFDLVTLAEGMQADDRTLAALVDAYGAAPPSPAEIARLRRLFHLREHAWAVHELASGHAHPGVRAQAERSAALWRQQGP